MRVAVIHKDMVDVVIDGRTATIIQGRPYKIWNLDEIPSVIIVQVKCDNGFTASAIVDAIQKGDE